MMELIDKEDHDRKRAPQVISVMTKIDNISKVHSRLGREHTNIERTCSWDTSLKRVEQIANELLKLVEEYHTQSKTIPKQSTYAKHSPELFTSNDEGYLDVNVPDVRSKKDRQHKQF